MTKKLCTLEYCDRPHAAKGLCKPHYYRQHKKVNGVTTVGPILPQNNQKTLAERLANYTVAAGCWIWNGSKNEKGYGRLSIDRKTVLAHRASYEFHKKVTVPRGQLIRHSCHTPSCVNPDHLAPGTVKDNSIDMVRAERQNSKLTAEQVTLIRQERATYNTSNADLALKYGVTTFQISRIVNNRSWTHLPFPEKNDSL